MRVVAGEARQVNLSSTITASGSQATLGAVQTTMAVPTGGTSFTYAGELTAPTGSAAALDDDTIRNPTFTPDVPGLYTVTITATDAASGASLTLVRTQEVASALSISLTASSSQSTLAAISTVATPTGGLGTITYQHTLTRPAASAASLTGDTTTTSSVTPDKAGSYTIVVVATDASGQTARAERVVEVVSTLAVSIAAVSDSASRPTSGTQALDSTVTGGLGTLSYAWTGKDPGGGNISFSDAAAADPTVTYAATQLPGLWTATVVVTDSARAQTASATVRWTTGGMPTATTPRAIYVAVVAGVPSWKEQVLIGSEWVDVGAYAALTTETDGGVTFSGTTMTLPSGLAATTTPHASGDERYVAFTSCTAALQALVAAGGRWQLDVNADTVENVDYGRIGWSVSSAAGSFDAAGENLLHARLGWDVTAGAYRLQIAASSGSFNNADTSASLGVLRFGAQIATANTGGVYAPAWSYNSSFTPGTDVPTRLYVTGSAQTSATAATIAVGNPTARLAFFPVVA